MAQVTKLLGHWRFYPEAPDFNSVFEQYGLVTSSPPAKPFVFRLRQRLPDMVAASHITSLRQASTYAARKLLTLFLFETTNFCYGPHFTMQVKAACSQLCGQLASWEPLVKETEQLLQELLTIPENDDALRSMLDACQDLSQRIEAFIKSNYVCLVEV